MRNSQERVVLFALFILSLAFRFIYISQLVKTPFFGLFAADSATYNEFALNILKGNFVFKDSIYLHPFYPVFLSFIYKIFGYSLTVVVMIQAFLDSFSGLLLYFISRKIFNKKTIGLLAFFIYSVYSISIFYTGFLLEATLSVFLIILLFFILIKIFEKPGILLWLFAGLIFSCAVLLRTSMAILLPFILAWYYLMVRKENDARTLIMPLFFLLGFLLVLVPFSLRNYLITRSFIPFSSHGGYNFYIGNNPGANGIYANIKTISNSGLEQVKDSVRLASKETKRTLSPFDASVFWFSEGWDFIRYNRLKFIKLTLRKIILFWNSQEIIHNINYYFCRRVISFLNLPLLSFGVVAPFALIGILLAWINREKRLYFLILFLGFYMFSVIIFFVADRFRLPAVTLIIILAAYAIDNIFITIKKGSIKKVIFPAILLLFFGFIVNAKIKTIDSSSSLAVSFDNLGQGYYQKGLFGQAIVNFKKSLVLMPDYAKARNNLAIVYLDKGMLKESEEELQKVLLLEEKSPATYNTLGRLYEKTARIDKAIEVYMLALKLNPDLGETHYNLGNAYNQKGLLEQAILEYKIAINLNPDNPKFYNNLGNIYCQLGRLDEAIEEYKKAVSLEYGLANAHANLGNIYALKGIEDKAVEEYEIAIRFNPKLGKAHYYLGMYYYSKNNNNRANYHFIQAIRNGIKIEGSQKEKLLEKIE